VSGQYGRRDEACPVSTGGRGGGGGGGGWPTGARVAQDYLCEIIGGGAKPLFKVPTSPYPGRMKPILAPAQRSVRSSECRCVHCGRPQLDLI